MNWTAESTEWRGGCRGSYIGPKPTQKGLEDPLCLKGDEYEACRGFSRLEWGCEMTIRRIRNNCDRNWQILDAILWEFDTDALLYLDCQELLTFLLFSCVVQKIELLYKNHKCEFDS